ncbi:MAG: MFS transporter [Spirochaetales bacterium]|nr:MFS transporter [Spirochaetales bacterium]
MIKFIKSRLNHTLLILGSFRGNARACIMTEPIWGIPYNLYIAYASLYMRALGLSARQIGTVAAVGLACEMIFALTGGVITDRLGRKRTALIFDLIGWSIPTLIWAFAGGYEYFLIAAVVNSIFRIVSISWTCLLVEDTLPRRRIHAYSWVFVASTLAGFFAPLAGLLVERAGLVPAVRGLYLFAFVAMTGMFILRNQLVRETDIGRQKMSQAKAARLREVVAEYRALFGLLKRGPSVVSAFVVVMLGQIQLYYNRYFLSILLKEGLKFPLGLVSLTPALASVAKMIVFIFVMPTLSRLKPSKAIMYGFAISAAGVAIVAASPEGGILIALLGVILEATGYAIITPFAESMLANAMVDEYRAKTVSLFATITNAISSPFGYLGGVLTAVSPRYPFWLVFGTLVVRFLLVGGTRFQKEKRSESRSA